MEEPFWTVIVPVYNRFDYLRETLDSVLAQDPGPSEMQILVLDDASESPEAETLVREIAPERIEFVRQPRNLGLAGNWNSGIDHARGRWIHYLHSDDVILPEFYVSIRDLVTAHPSVRAAFSGYQSMDEAGRARSTAPPERDTPGIIPDWLERISGGQRVQCHTMVVQRSLYLELGGFSAQHPFALDWEMWVRVAAHTPVAYHPSPFARYRVHGGSETGRLQKSGESARDVFRVTEAMRAYLPETDRERLVARARAWCTDYVFRSAARLLEAGDREAAHAQLRVVLAETPTPATWARAAWLYGWSAKVGLKRALG